MKTKEGIFLSKHCSIGYCTKLIIVLGTRKAMQKKLFIEDSRKDAAPLKLMSGAVCGGGSGLALAMIWHF